MRRLLESRIGTLLLAVALVVLLTAVAHACPNCSEAMEKQDPTHGGMVKGYFYSILFMMVTPYLIFGGFCGAMYYRIRRARQTPKAPLAGAATSAPIGESIAPITLDRRVELREIPSRLRSSLCCAG